MSAGNPWLSHPTSTSLERTSSATVTRGRVPAPTGPLVPQPGVPAPDHVDRLPIREHPQAAELWVVGTHGGSGESTLAALAPGWTPAAHAWPRVPDVTGPARVVLTARSSAHGLLSAQRAATQWAAGLVPDVDVLGLVVVADAPGRLPRPLRDLAHVVGGGVARTWHVPWVEAWRLGEPSDPTNPNGPASPAGPGRGATPRAVRRLMDDLDALLQPSSTSHSITPGITRSNHH